MDQREVFKILIQHWIFCVMIIQAFSLHVDRRPASCSADKFADGCSVPSVIPAPFKKEFTPACNRHDICYGCGYHYNWSRAQCDEAFYKNMKLICEHLRTRRSVLDYFLNLWNTINKIGSTKSQCLTSAKIYYEGVHLFADSHFDRKEHDYCLSTCADKHGNPKFNVTV